MVHMHILLIEPTGKYAEVEPLQVYMVKMPEHDEDKSDDSFSAVRHDSRWNHSTWEDPGDDLGEPDDKSRYDHDQDGEGQEPIRNLLLEVVFPKAGFLFLYEQQIEQH